MTLAPVAESQCAEAADKDVDWDLKAEGDVEAVVAAVPDRCFGVGFGNIHSL